ncbi:efflux RND transporter periplasmic adaptor subunit [Vibrio europaeus]|uniref:efflux RND transporter periplasmic adaptor subunit n=1 Tax=Vibrio europaeus TaxID=300876 RepID=UPI0039E0400C
MNKKTWLLGGLLFSGLAILFLYMAGVFTPKLPVERQVRMMSAPSFDTAKLVASEETIKREFSGRVVAEQKATVASRLTATVAEVIVSVGDQVKQGDILIRLESGDLDAKVEQTEQALVSAQSTLNNARKEYQRVKELLSRKLVPQSQYDQAENHLQTSQAALMQAKAAVTEAETTFGYSVITAPFDGIITQKTAHQGDTATPGSALLSMYNPQSLVVEADIAESVLPHIELGKTLALDLPTNGIIIDSTVNEITPSADAGSRSYLIKLAFETEKKVYPGNFARVSVELGTQQVVRVPLEAIYQVGQLDYVKVVQGGEVHTRLVQLGEDFRVRKGLKAGDIVVLNPSDI